MQDICFVKWEAASPMIAGAWETVHWALKKHYNTNPDKSITWILSLLCVLQGEEAEAEG